MVQTETLTKILNVREIEEKDAQIAHHQSVTFFENLATELYQLLRKKEAAESTYEKSIKKSITIEELQNQFNYIELLKEKIIKLQNRLNKAREHMEIKQEKLTSAHIEVKKIEKLIENRINEQKEKGLKIEQQFLDEISVQQYLNRNIGGNDGITYE